MICNALEHTANRIPDHPAIIQDERVVTFGRLLEMAKSAESYFKNAGLHKGDRVLLLLDNGPEYAAMFFGLMGAGAVVVPLNPTNTADNVRFIAKHCDGRFAVVNERSHKHITGWWKGHPVVIEGPTSPGTVPLADVLGERPSSLIEMYTSVDDMGLALILYTSGTTGEPKGVMLSHRNLAVNTESILGYLRLNPSDRTIAVLPFYYSYGNSILLTHVFSGATLVIENRFAYMSRTITSMREQRVTGLSGVPSHFAMLIGRSRFLEFDWPHLRYMTCAGGPLPSEHIRKVRNYLPDVQLHIMYGQTEGAARLSSLDPSLIDHKIGSIGKGIPGVEIKVVRKDGGEVEPEEIGEIVARGENIMMGYLGDPSGTGEALRDGWLHTGDLATVDKDGFVYIRGREKEIIKSGGYRIGPAQIEEIVVQHPSVLECAVVGCPDDILGESIAAFVTLKPGFAEEGLEGKIELLCRERLPNYMVPSAILIVEGLPKTETGKVKKLSLRERAARSEALSRTEPAQHVQRSEQTCDSRETRTATLLQDTLSQSARRFPQKIALTTSKRNWTYEELERQSNALARDLLSRGFRRGDRLAIFLDNSVEYIVGVYGALKAGGVFVPLNPSTKMMKLAYILKDAKVAALLSEGSKVGEHIEMLKSQVTSLLHIYLTDANENTPLFYSYGETLKDQTPYLAPEQVDVDLAAIIYTSGSTGVPKGVMLTHLNMLSAARSITTYLDNGPDDVVLNVLPLSFDYGLYQVLMMLMIGGRIVLEEPFVYPADIIKKLKEHAVTGFPCVPTIFAMLFRVDAACVSEIPAIRYLTNTGSAYNARYIRKTRELFPASRIYSMYGLTECKRVSYLPPEELDKRPGSVGKAMPNVEVWIVREDGTRAISGEVGELVVRGSNVMQGYWGDPEMTAHALRPGPLPSEKVLYTGDLFRMDRDGFLYFVSRKDDIIKCRGEKVSPREVENTICQHPDIRDAAVIGVADDVLGQAVHAHVVPISEESITEEDIRRYCIENMEPNMIPKRIIFHKELPRNTSGKIDKSALLVRKS